MYTKSKIRTSSRNHRISEAELSKQKGSLNSLIQKHNDEICAITGNNQERVDHLIDILTVMTGETTQPAVIAKIENEVIPKIREMKNFNKALEYLYSGIFLKGERLSMGRLYDRNRIY